ncbi:hypothetical protein [Turicibacter bilis]|uniref:hypothetical protein n=1 Tax=Turicibacter bilis TaxID=2735723 RepID=UPI0031BB3ABD
MKLLKIILFSLAIVITGLLSLFAWGCVGGQYNQDVLNELTGQIIYTRRDTDSILKIYTAQANLENEQLLYEHQDSIDNGTFRVLPMIKQITVLFLKPMMTH